MGNAPPWRSHSAIFSREKQKVSHYSSSGNVVYQSQWERCYHRVRQDWRHAPGGGARRRAAQVRYCRLSLSYSRESGGRYRAWVVVTDRVVVPCGSVEVGVIGPGTGG